MQGLTAPRSDTEALRRRLFQAVFDEFDQTGKWPSLDRLSRQLVEEMDVHEVAEGLDHPWVRLETSAERTIELRLPAIALCSKAEELAEAFIRTLQLAVTKYFGADPTPELTQQGLVSELGLSNLRAHQALILYKNENLWSSINGSVPGDWVIKVDRHVRPYRDVKTLQEYVERRYRSDLLAHPLSGEKGTTRIPLKAEAAPLIFLSHSGSAASVSTVAAVLRESFGSAIQVWSDADLPGGRWDENIREQLSKSTAFVLVGTPSVLGSVYVGFETGYVDARLGQRNVFVLRVGVQVGQLQNRPPLSHYQSFDGTTAVGLQDFISKLGQELGIGARGQSGLEEAAARLAAMDNPPNQGEVDNSSAKSAAHYEVAREDMTAWDRISRIVCGPLGERGAIWCGRTLIALGALLLMGLFASVGTGSQIAATHPVWLGIAMYGGVGAPFLGFGSIRAAHHQANRRCDDCHKNYALEEIGTPTARDLPLGSGARGDLQRVTYRTYRCNNCGRESTARWNRTIRAKGF